MKPSMIATALAAVSLVAGPACAASSGLPCLRPHQAEDLVVFLLPTLVDVARNACAASLPPDAVLADRGLSDRYRAESADAWPGAKKAIGHGDGGIASLLGDDSMRDIVVDAVGKEAARMLKPESCVTADRLVSGLAPLPARNIAQIVVAMAALAKVDERLPIKLCSTAAPR